MRFFSRQHRSVSRRCGGLVSRMSRSESQRAEMLVWRRVPWVVVVSPVFVFGRSPADHGVPAK